MSTQVQSRPVTADELLRMPDDGFRYELVRGELRKMTPPGGEHGQIALIAGASLLAYAEGRGGAAFGAETGFRLATDPDTVRAPDAAYVRKERSDGMDRVQGYLPGAPDLAVEVVSPGDTYGEVEEQVLEWLDAGARMVVLVNPRRRTATVYESREEIRVLREEDVIEGGTVLPGWTLPVRRLFT